MSWKGWTSLILGIWFVVAAFIPGMLGMGNLVNDLIVGIVLAIVGFMMIPSGSAWQGWTIGLVGGVWMIVAAFIPSIVNNYSYNMWNDLIIGIIVLIVALFERTKKSA